MGKQEDTVPAEMEAGDLLLFSGKLIHGGGANCTKDHVRRALTIPFQPGYLTPEEAFAYLVDMDIARSMAKRAQKMIGFRSTFPTGSPGLWQNDSKEIATFSDGCKETTA